VTTSTPVANAKLMSIGSFSNQLWKLGQIEVPEDLISTIQYKILHPEEKGPPAKSKRSGMRTIAVAAISILLTVALLGGTAYFIKRRHSLGRNDEPIVRTDVIRTFEPLPDNEAAALFGRLEAMAEKLGVSKKEYTAEGEAGKESSGD